MHTDSHGARLGEDVRVYVHHEVTARRVLHDEAHVFRRLEARKQVDQEAVVRAGHRLEDPLLAHQTAVTPGDRSGVRGQETKTKTTAAGSSAAVSILITPRPPPGSERKQSI